MSQSDDIMITKTLVFFVPLTTQRQYHLKNCREDQGKPARNDQDGEDLLVYESCPMPLHDENQCSLTHGVDNHAVPEGSPGSQTLVSAEKHRGKRPHNCVGKHSKTQRVFAVTPQMASCFTQLPRHTYDDESNNSSPSKVCGMSMPHFQKEVRRQLDENPYHEEEEKKSQRPQKSDLGHRLARMHPSCENVNELVNGGRRHLLNTSR